MSVDSIWKEFFFLILFLVTFLVFFFFFFFHLARVKRAGSDVRFDARTRDDVYLSLIDYDVPKVDR